MCSGQLSSAHFSRADAIQKLTLFIAFLEWVRRTVVQRVLNHVLEPPLSAAVVNPDVQRDAGGMAFDPMLMSFNEMATGDLDWLNTIDWTQGSWMEFN